MSLSFRRPRPDLAASEGLALETAVPAALRERDTGPGDDRPREGDPVVVEGERGPAAASGQDGDVPLGEADDWRLRFESPEALFEAFRNVDRLRGRLGHELGIARRQGRLYERVFGLIASASDPMERVAFAMAGRLIREEAALENVEEMLAAAEEAREAYEQEEVAGAVRA